MSTPIQENGRLDGWKAISDHLGWHVRTVMRWEQHRGLPIHRVPGGQRHAVFAFRRELDEWLNSGQLDHDDLVEDPEFPPNIIAKDLPAPVVPTIESVDLAVLQGSGPIAAHPGLWSNRRKVLWVTTGLVLLALVGYTVHSLAFPPRIEFTSLVQLTHDGTLKEGLVTDGKALYFGEHHGSQIVLASSSANGGPIRSISTPFMKVIPMDVSPDGKRLLVVAWEGIEVDRSLWIVPVEGGQPTRVGEILCHAAKWSLDGRRIAFTAQNAIFVTDDLGVSAQQIQSFNVTPRHILWSADGKRLRFDLEDQKNATFSIWELTLSDQDRSQVSSLIPLHAPLKDCWSPSLTLDGSGRSFVTGGRCGAEGIYLLEEHQEFWNSRFDFLEMNPMVHNIANLALDKNSSKVFAVGEYAGPQSVEEAEHLDLIKFNVRSQEFRPFLPGLNASYVDFTRNGTMIAYVRLPEQTLWISRPDGSGARQIELQTNHLELPRWSPDGRSLAFMAQTQGKPWRILVVSANGGKPKEGSSGTDNQGAPTWSPDGKWLVYGNVECQEAKTCAIHRIDLSSGRVYTVPNSEGLGTARWSPDGKFIAALSPTEHDVRVFDLASQQWRKLVDGVNGNDLNWSVDSRYLYASRSAGGRPEILRVSLADSTAETEVDLRSFAVLTGHIGTWFTLAPDGSIVFFREMSGNEVYSMTYAEK